jgi:ketosteroid isomerase-like protein
MSQENVEMVRRGFDAVRRGDREGVERVFDADAVWHNTREFPGPATCVGPQAIVDFWATLLDSFEEDGRLDIERVVDGGETVVMSMHSVVRGKASGAPLDLRWAVAFTVRGGRVSRADVYGSWEKALQAVRLAE